MSRLIAVSGKGGVGKTLYSIALTKSLREQGKEAYYINFENQNIPNCFKNNEHIVLSTAGSTSEYITKKLGSKTISNWITDTKFFKAVYGLLPGLSHMIMLGHILDILEKSPHKIIILDSPASGHFISVLSIPNQFKKILKLGAIANDIDRMMALMTNPGFFNIKLLTIPTSLAVQETKETVEQIEKLQFPKPEIILNNSLENIFKSLENPPPFLIQKIENENKLLGTHNFKKIIPYIVSLEPKEIIEKISGQLNE